MQYLVTGGCGFIGSHLVDKLLADGHSVLVLDDLSTGSLDNLNPEAEFVRGCITDQAAVDAAMRNVDGVFHLAAIASVARSNEEWSWTHKVNLTGFVHVADAARARKCPVVYASSAAIYGDNCALPLSETDEPRPMTAYGADKLGCELHGRVGALIHGIPTTGLRFFNVYGPRQDPKSPYSGVISIFADRVMRGEPLKVFGDGHQTRDFVYVGDVVRCLDAAMQTPVRGARVFNVCTGRATSIRELAHLVMMAAGREVAVRYLEARAGDIHASIGDPRRLRSAFGFKPETSVGTGLMQLLSSLGVGEKAA
ncbi:NAD-dependent epimerase/dehydratase family protein [Nisaea sp.]|uniref:NAD-dependent epimerase/dehydratase family protein n=1 Tax=Nisaea sp. TaxID=2024842 RepID=UPI002B276415|nr:NAD-dependent epimerase/dehydratase family protein [Nisaea sp.]